MIPALTVRAPWAGAFFRMPADQAKTVENRTWSTQYRGRIAIHVGQQVDPAGLEFLNLRALSDFDARNLGHIIGTVELVGVHTAGTSGCDDWGCRTNPWAFHPLEGQRLVHWNVDHAREFVTPIKAQGKLQLWDPGPSVSHLMSIAEVEP